MIELQRGGNAPVEGSPVAVRVDWSGPAGLEADISAYLLGEDGRVGGDHDMIFFNQLSGGGGAVTLSTGAGSSSFAIDLARVPASVARITFCLTVDGGQTFAALTRADLGVSGPGTDIRFPVPRQGASEAAMILGELYRRQGAWKFRAVGQGFDGGLGPLARSFGIAVDDEPTGPSSAPLRAAAPPDAPSQSDHSSTAGSPAPQPPTGGVDFAKPPPVILTKPEQSQRVLLSKESPDKLIVSAVWIDNGDSRADNDDLDLRVGILLPDGSFQMIHAPKASGAFDRPPYVFHTGDVRQATAKMPGREIVEVNPAIARHSGGPVGLVFSVYSAVSNGAVSVASLQPRMRMEYRDQVVDCAIDWKSHKAARKSTVYTFVLGTVVIDIDGLTLRPSGATSKPWSEKTPRIKWLPDGSLDVTVDGPHLFKT